MEPSSGSKSNGPDLRYLPGNNLPIPTGAFWSNFLFEDGLPVVAHPYVFRWSPSSLMLSYPKKISIDSGMSYETCSDIIVSWKPVVTRKIASWTDISVTLAWGTNSAILVQGSPYTILTLTAGAFSITSKHDLISTTRVDVNTYWFTYSNGAKWLLAGTSRLNCVITSNEVSLRGYTGCIVIARSVSFGSVSEDLDRLLLSYARDPITGGTIIHRVSRQVEIITKYNTKSGRPGLFGLLPHASHNVGITPVCTISYDTLKGPLKLYVSNSSTVTLPIPPIEWSGKIQHVEELLHIMKRECNLQEIPHDSYESFKEMSRVARICTLAETIGYNDIVNSCRTWLERALESRLPYIVYDKIWKGIALKEPSPSECKHISSHNDKRSVSGTSAHAGICVPSASHTVHNPVQPSVHNPTQPSASHIACVPSVHNPVQPSASHTVQPLIHVPSVQPSASHTTHTEEQDNTPKYNNRCAYIGHILYAIAVLMRSDLTLWSRYRMKIRELLDDVVGYGSARFPKTRCKDWWEGHSWSTGLDSNIYGKTHTSASEIIQCYYSAGLIAKVTNNTILLHLTQALLATEIEAIKAYIAPHPAYSDDTEYFRYIHATRYDIPSHLDISQQMEAATAHIYPLLPITKYVFSPEWLHTIVHRIRDGLVGQVGDNPDVRMVLAFFSSCLMDADILTVNSTQTTEQRAPDIPTCTITQGISGHTTQTAEQSISWNTVQGIPTCTVTQCTPVNSRDSSITISHTNETPEWKDIVSHPGPDTLELCWYMASTINSSPEEILLSFPKTLQGRVKIVYV